MFKSFLSILLYCLALMHPLSLHAEHRPHSKPAISVGIVLFEGVQIIDFSAPYEVFGQAGFGVQTLTADGKPVTTAMGLKVTPDIGFAEAAQFDVLLVPGGDVSDAQKDQALRDFLRRQSVDAKHVLSVCTGSYILAAGGLLDGLKATTFHRSLSHFARSFPKIDVIRDVRWSDNGKFITSAGLSSGIDASLHVVARIRGTDVARATAMHLEYDWHPEQGFVRTRMADRYLPELSTVQWPKDVDFHQLISVGDEQHWRKRFRVRSSTGAADVLELIATAMQSEQGWARDTEARGYRWRRQDKGSALTLDILSESSAGDAEFELAIELSAARLGATP